MVKHDFPLLFQIIDQLKALQAEVKALKEHNPADTVDAALQNVRQLASAPTRLRDPSMIAAALQILADKLVVQSPKSQRI